MTRHELKDQLQHDQFTDTVASALNYASSHRQRLISWGVIAALVLLAIGAAFWINSYRAAARRQDLGAAFAIVDATVGPSNGYTKTFATEEEKRDASIKALSNVVAKDAGTHEGFIAQYYLGCLKAQKNDTHGAEADLLTVAKSRSDSAALAKIALAQLYVTNHRTSEAQELLKSIVNKPTDLVSKSQAEILLAQLVASSNPQESKRILQSLKAPGERSAVSRAADQLSAQLTK